MQKQNMPDKNAATQFTLGVQEINIDEFFLAPAPQEALDMKQVSFNLRLDLMADRTTKRVSVKVFMSVHPSAGSTGQDSLANLTVSVIYNIENFEEVILDTATGFNVPQDIALMLNSIAITTARGVFAAMYRGTYLGKAILPIIDPKSLQQAESQ